MGISATLEPAESLVAFVQQLATGSEAHGGSDAPSPAIRALTHPVNAEFEPIGPPFMAVAREVSTQGIVLVHVHTVSAEYLTVQMLGARNERIAVAVKVQVCHPLGPYFEIHGKLIRKVAVDADCVPSRSGKSLGKGDTSLNESVARHEEDIAVLKRRFCAALKVVESNHRRLNELESKTEE